MLSGVGNNSTIQVVSRHLVNDTPFTTVHGTVVNGTLVSHISQKGRKCWPRTQRERPTGMRQPAASCFLRPGGKWSPRASSVAPDGTLLWVPVGDHGGGAALRPFPPSPEWLWLGTVVVADGDEPSTPGVACCCAVILCAGS